MTAHDTSLLIGAIWVVFVVILVIAIHRQHRARIAALEAELRQIEDEYNAQVNELASLRENIGRPKP